jgi:hypothetical protein
MIVRGRAIGKRTCDICGATREMKANVFRSVAGRYVCNWHPHYIPSETLDKLPMQTFKVRPIKGAKPFAPRDTYETAEREIFDFVTNNYTADYVDITNGAGVAVNTTNNGRGVRGAGWAGIYLYELISEAKRPVAWVNQAKTKLKEIADWLLTRMVGGPHKAGYTSGDVQWGGFDRQDASGPDGEYMPRDSGAAGLALLRAYQVHGTSSYLEGARACAWFIRGAQCGDKMTIRFSSSDSGGTARIHHGMWPTLWSVAGGGTSLQSTHYYEPGCLIALEFLQAFKDVVGDETIGSSDIAGFFNSSRAALVSTAIAEAKTFWTTGPFDATRAAVTNGLSSTTPFEAFNSYPAATKVYFTGTGSWEYQDGSQAAGTRLIALEWAIGLRGLRAAGADVTALFDWLMGFSSNATHELPADDDPSELRNYTDKTLWSGVKGTYDPKVALATLLRVRESGAAVTKNDTATLDFAAVGALAALYSSRQQAKFATLKAELNEPRRRAYNLQPSLYLGAMGNSGLSFQPWTDVSLIRWRVVQYAAMAGLIYRQAPQAFMARGH